MSAGFLLDTMVPSELSRPQPDRNVHRWLIETDDALMFISAISIGEMYKGFTVHPDEKRRAILRRGFEEAFQPWFGGNVLPVSQAIGKAWGILDGESQRKGRKLSMPDGLIAATALEHGLTVVTRNVRDFKDLGLTLLDPWQKQ